MYNPQEIEPKWQEKWGKEGFYRAEDFDKKPKKYILIEFPYPSGGGLHVGHVRSYSAMDAVSRKKRMEGFNVLYPIGWDAFGLPTENYAIKTGVHPSVATAENINNYKRQLKSLGLSFDWSREINTTDPKYYKWTQWIFLKLFQAGLVYQAEIPINWCPSCKIGLANEEVIGGGECERCRTQVGKKTLKQWMIKITVYADRLIEDLKDVDYPEKVKTQQTNWIGKSYGAEIKFSIPNSQLSINVFTTRVDTVFGVTAIVLAPEHPLVGEITKDEYKNEAERYISEAEKKSDIEREMAEKEKTGVFTGSYCVNPANGEKVPVWIGDYVVASYGGGAVMVVPAHDQRDFEFAQKYDLPIKMVICPNWPKPVCPILEKAYTGEGHLVGSGEFDGLESKTAIEKITDWLEKKNLGSQKVHYKLRDWVFSRQHYWGEPIPIVHCKKCGPVAVSEKDLPIELPFVERYQPTGTGESPLAAATKWVDVSCPKCGGPAKRETDTMPNWAGSNWYYLRYCDPKNDKKLADGKKLKYWMPVDWYNGGFEHTTLHLLYSRFIYKFLFDIGIVPAPEPYRKRTSHGIVLAQDGRKMSKSFGNVINPDEIVKEFGADSLRLYEMFMGPFDQMIVWNTNGLKGCYRFLEKFWNLVLECAGNVKSSPRIIRDLHKLNKKIDEDLEAMKFNTIIASFMEFVNLALELKKEFGKKEIEKMLILISPFAPHISEELWEKIGRKKSVFLESWPKYDLKSFKEETIKLVIQVNGRFRDAIEVEADVSEEKAKMLAISSKKVNNWIAGKEIKKVVFIPKKIINIVI